MDETRRRETEVVSEQIRIRGMPAGSVAQPPLSRDWMATFGDAFLQARKRVNRSCRRPVVLGSFFAVTLLDTIKAGKRKKLRSCSSRAPK